MPTTISSPRPRGSPSTSSARGFSASRWGSSTPDFQEGDAFLHNDPYLGNTHPADHTILVPVFAEGEHVFTTCVKAHQADIGNAIPTTYTPKAIDVYAEGALIFPCVWVQRDYQDVGDIIRMCEKRIRVPEIWYGDYLAMVAGPASGSSASRSSAASSGWTPSSASSASGRTTANGWRSRRSESCRPGASTRARRSIRSRACRKASRCRRRSTSTRPPAA